MLAAFKSNPAPIFRLDWGVNESISEWKGSVFQVLEGSAPLPSPWGGETAIADGDVLLTAGAAAVGEAAALMAAGTAATANTLWVWSAIARSPTCAPDARLRSAVALRSSRAAISSEFSVFFFSAG